MALGSFTTTLTVPPTTGSTGTRELGLGTERLARVAYTRCLKMAVPPVYTVVAPICTRWTAGSYSRVFPPTRSTRSNVSTTNRAYRCSRPGLMV